MDDMLRDLIHPKQVKLFDALERLSSFDTTGDIETPELVVVGDQSNGKSSVLEAIAGFRFPVQQGLCTRFPTKLILRRAREARTHVSIKPVNSRTEKEKKRLAAFAHSISYADGLDDVVQRAVTELGLSSSPTDRSGTQETTGKFAEDTLVIEKYGPDLPLLSLVDLPGLFQGESALQDAASRKQVTGIVEGYIRSKQSVVLLVVSAQCPFVNHMSLRCVQDQVKIDPGLADRTVGVLTMPDAAADQEELFRILRGEEDSSLNRPWHVVRNQGKEDRDTGTLADRDAIEIGLFKQGSWREVPEAQKGIHALRTALRDIIWTHAQRGLSGIITEVRQEIAKAEKSLAEFSKPRDTHSARQIYLHGIATKFEKLVENAVRGDYINEPCRDSHLIGKSCPGCEPFFAPFGDNLPESQDKRLRSKVRLLCKAFTLSMRRYGKTKVIIGDSGHADTNGVRGEGVEALGLDESDISQPHAREMLKRYCSYQEPAQESASAHEKWVDDNIALWRRFEPSGESSEATYAGLFQYQSGNWERIASGHLETVWVAIKRFVSLALCAVCPDKEVLQALERDIIQGALEKLDRASTKMMMKMVACHGQGKSGFYDSFVGIRRVRSHTHDVTGDLARLLRDTLTAATAGNGSNAESLLRSATTQILNVFALPTSGVILNDLMKGEVLGIVRNALASSADSGSTKAASKAAETESAPSGRDTAAKRAIEHVEMYYEINMLSFVGYINALVIEQGILYELPGAMFTPGIVLGLSEETVERIAGEKPDVARKREREKQNLENLKEILKTLTSFQE